VPSDVNRPSKALLRCSNADGRAFGACEVFIEAGLRRSRVDQLQQSAAVTSLSTHEDDQKEPKMESIMPQQRVRRGDNVERRAAYVKGTRPTRTPFKLAQSPLRG
jgi:hypothetical protein